MQITINLRKYYSKTEIRLITLIIIILLRHSTSMVYVKGNGFVVVDNGDEIVIEIEWT